MRNKRKKTEESKSEEKTKEQNKRGGKEVKEDKKPYHTYS